jgi:hypothetical protein
MQFFWGKLLLLVKMNMQLAFWVAKKYWTLTRHMGSSIFEILNKVLRLERDLEMFVYMG